MKKILIIDDDIEIINITVDFLNRSGYETLSSQNGDEALEILQNNKEIDLIIVDLVMPIINGIEFCREIRNSDIYSFYKKIPIIMLTGLSDISDKFIGFEAGADDYLTKPFQTLELLLRIKSLLKRSDPSYNISEIPVKAKTDSKNNHIITKIDKKNAMLTIDDKEIHLTNTEFDIFNYLLSHNQNNITADEILEKVLKYQKGTGNPAVIRAHIKNIRNKIEEKPSVPQILVNVQGRGYSINSSKVQLK
ncbi:MAG: response regulator transcription factor [Candidatus Sericytochromatia bacterium]